MRPWCLLVWMLCAATPAWAQSGPSPEEKETARGLFRRGDELYRAGDYPAALEAFHAADQIMRVPTTALELGRTQLALRQLVEARDTLMRAARLPEEPGEADIMDDARAEAEQLAQQIAADIPTLRVEIRGPEPGTVRILVDGKNIAAAAIAHGVKVNPGVRVLRAEADGFITRERNVDVAKGQERIVTMTMRAAVPSSEAKRTVVVDRDEPPVAPAEAATSDALIIGWISFGIAGAGVALGAITGAMTLSKETDLEAACPGRVCPVEQQDALADAMLLSEVSTAGFAVGAVAAALGVTAMIVASEGETDVALSVRPGGAAMRVAF